MLKTLLISLGGWSILTGGLSLNIGDILNETRLTVNTANLHQLAVALELYYLDHNYYPLTNESNELFIQLKPYLKNPPTGTEAYVYQVLNRGQEYQLNLR